MALIDSFGRRINYLRLSVTDRCNLRCCYCMPADGIAKIGHADVLSYEDLYVVARESVSLGIEKIRITGGEPLVRKGIVGFIERLSGIPGLKELVLTTNGQLLREYALRLRRAGVCRLNISLDSLDSGTYSTITRGGSLPRALDGIAAAEDAGFPPPKINVVAMRGVNDGEIADFAALTLDKRYTVRFIEYMPTMKQAESDYLRIPGEEILERIGRRFSLTPMVSSEMSGPAQNFKIHGAAGAIGIITAVSGHFCGSCNRIRVTASGMARGCLFGDRGIDLRHYLRSDHGELRSVLEKIIVGKPEGHRLRNELQGYDPFAMSQVGG